MSEAKDSNDTTLEQYKLYLGDLQSLGTRHEHSRKYYLTIISALFTILSLGGSRIAFGLRPGIVGLVAIFGGCLCLLWAVHMWSYCVLFKAKFKVLGLMEEQLSSHPFEKETVLLFAKGSNYVSMTKIDLGVAFIFIILFAVLPLLTLCRCPVQP